MSDLISPWPEKDFLILIWATYKLGRSPNAVSARAIQPPRDLRRANSFLELGVFPWELETLLNEYFVSARVEEPKRRLGSPDENWNQIALMLSKLRHLENSEFLYFGRSQSIWAEMRRIPHRQFFWQQDITNKLYLFRAAYLFGKEFDEIYYADYGSCFEKVFKTGFAYFAHFMSQPIAKDFVDLRELGIDEETNRAVLERLCLSIDAAKVEDERPKYTGYRSSLLRPNPIIRTDDGSLFCPLVELLFERITLGLYYDLVKAGPEVMKAVSKNFENYVTLIFSEISGLDSVETEFVYKTGKEKILSPDVLGIRDGSLDMIVECKLKRMPVSMKFGDADLSGRIVDDLAKAIVQIWKFHDDVCLGRVGLGYSSETEPLGLVVTLDDWFTLNSAFVDYLLDKAREIAAEKIHDFREEKEIPVAFMSIGDLEEIAGRASYDDLRRFVLLSTDTDLAGWNKAGLFKDKISKNPRVAFKFLDDLDKVLPGWGQWADGDAAG